MQVATFFIFYFAISPEPICYVKILVGKQNFEVVLSGHTFFSL